MNPSEDGIKITPLRGGLLVEISAKAKPITDEDRERARKRGCSLERQPPYGPLKPTESTPDAPKPIELPE